MSLDPTHIPDQPYDSDAVNRARNLLEAIPETVGPYRILERIGTGGMGDVYRAEQRTPIRREVALKLIKLGMDTKLVIARFEAERQALALMDHPHIAKVFDANADEAAQRALADQQRELAERQLIDGLLRPIGYGDEPTTAELRSFVEWLQIPDARLKLRVLDVAFENPEVALRLARRAERAMQACIGLSPARRAKAIERLSAKQRDMKADARIRIAATWLAMELGSSDLPTAVDGFAYFSMTTSSRQKA